MDIQHPQFDFPVTKYEYGESGPVPKFESCEKFYEAIRAFKERINATYRQGGSAWVPFPDQKAT